MNPEVRGRMQRRIEDLRARLVVRRWEHRQRGRAKGVWYRLRRVLAGAERVYSAPEEVAAVLRAEGYAQEPVGLELHPNKCLFYVPAERIEGIPVRPLEPRLDPELLAAPVLVLVPFGRAR